MTEILFVLSVLFIAYIFHSSSDEKRESNKQPQSKSKPLAESPAQTTSNTVSPTLKQETTPTPENVLANSSTTENNSSVSVENVVAAPANSQQTRSDEASASTEISLAEMIAETQTDPNALVLTDFMSKKLRNPKTGEIAVPHSNYQFMKRWIKEALVEEGLVAKIYKASEMDSATEQSVKHGLQQLSQMEKYRP